MSGAWLEYCIEDAKLQEIANKLGNEDLLHVTICYFGRNLTENQLPVARLLINRWVKFFPKKFTAGCAYGLSLFNENLAVQRLWMPSRIELQRTLLLNSFYGPNIKWHNDFDWNPHITLGKGDQNTFLVESFEQPTEVTIDRLWLHHDFGDKLDQWSLE